MSEHALYRGEVMHLRLRPFRHGFRYAAFTLLLDLDELGRLPWPLRHNGRGLMAISDRDHGPRDGRPLKPWIEARLAEAGIDLAGGRVRLLAMPRVLGRVFNPLSLWFCHHADGSLRAILYEVRNTFGEAHSYLLPLQRAPAAGDVIQQQCDKGFYVSPFIGPEATYRFRLKLPGETLSLVIRESVPEGPQLVASLSGRRRALTSGALLAALARFPLLTLQVLGAIHWQALRLWLKGASFHRRPAPPTEAVTLAGRDLSQGAAREHLAAAE